MTNLPYVINGTIIDEDENGVASTIVTAHNTTTGERTTVTTQVAGKYVLDLANLTSGWTAADAITMYVRNNGYVGESQTTVTGDNQTVDFTTSNQVTNATIRNTLWKAIYDTLQTGTFAITTDSIYSAMNDQIISSVGYPLVIIHPPMVGRLGVNLPNTQQDNHIGLQFDIYHTSSANCKVLADDVENQLWRAQEVWDGLGLYNLVETDSDNDYYTDGNKKIHVISLNVDFKYDGVVAIP